mgnify:CR=1 FL=1
MLFNCAGVVHNGTIEQASDDDLAFAFALNVRAQMWTIQAVLPGMLAAGRGSIINMASVCSSMKGLPNRFVYGTTKAAVLGLTKAMARESAHLGVTVNSVAPGLIDTEMLRGTVQSSGALTAAAANIPLGRIGTVDDVAGAVDYLVSEQAAYITGNVIDVNGGYRMQ